MRVRLMKEFGYEEALFGIGLSYGKVSGYATPEEAQQHDEWSRLCELAPTLALYGAGGHDKFLRQIGVILDITAPLYWWKQMDTYKVSTVAQSESTMHTLLKNPITKDCFEFRYVPDFYIDFLEDFLGSRMIDLFKSIKLAFDPNLVLNPGKVIEFNR